jgi:TolA-binding protein
MSALSAAVKSLVLRAGVCLWVCSLSGVAHAGLFADDDARKAIVDLRAQFRLATEENRARLDALANEMANLGSRHEALLKRFNDLEAKVETLTLENRQLRAQVEQAAKDLRDSSNRVAEIQSRLKEVSGRFDPISVSFDGLQMTVMPEEKQAFDEAMAFYRAEEFGISAVLLESFRARFDKSGYRPVVNFWLGMSQMGKKDCRQAMESLRAYMRESPAGSYVPKAMFSVGNCQATLKDRTGARRTFEELIKAYPAFDEIPAARELLSQLR